MFRRNRPHRFGPRIGRGPLAQPAIQALRQAHHLMAAGEHRQAAEIFSQLARGAQNLARPMQAANLHAQAGMSWAEAGQPANALQHARMALRGFLALKMLPRFTSYHAAVIAALNRNGLTEAAGQLQAEFSGQASIQPEPPPAAPVRPRLPVACPQCGAPVRSDEVEWVDAYGAECAFCGAIIQGE